MALMSCPYCGEQLSDTVKVCIHCGKRFARNEAAEIILVYDSLSSSEQMQLEKEFLKKDNTYRKVYAQRAEITLRTGFLLLHLAIYVGIMAMVFFLLPNFLGGLYYDKSGFFDLFFSFLHSFLWFFIVYNILSRQRKRTIKNTKNWMLLLKKYQKWLYDEKRIEYTLPTDYIKKWKEEFSTADPDAKFI